MSKLWHTAFVYGSTEIDPEEGYPKYPALRAEAAVYAESAEAVRQIVRERYLNLIHFECLYIMATGTFIITSPEEVCPN